MQDTYLKDTFYIDSTYFGILNKPHEKTKTSSE